LGRRARRPPQRRTHRPLLPRPSSPSAARSGCPRRAAALAQSRSVRAGSGRRAAAPRAALPAGPARPVAHSPYVKSDANPLQLGAVRREHSQGDGRHLAALQLWLQRRQVLAHVQLHVRVPALVDRSAILAAPLKRRWSVRAPHRPCPSHASVALPPAVAPACAGGAYWLGTARAP